MAKTWAQKVAEARAKDKAKLKAKQAARKTTAYSSALNQGFDIFTQLVGVTDDWAGTGKKKKK